ncbi:hypothetical protein JCGZ_01596 [Jatropha curcas]|uniref:Uncharacterized protein n=1 Tax=Jatropha curcas TaxID=180498 RepID=A0A067L1J5_JATCU|nr:hypothetical protein JCGZ_01596 [Jatropha curcas]
MEKGRWKRKVDEEDEDKDEEEKMKWKSRGLYPAWNLGYREVLVDLDSQASL